MKDADRPVPEYFPKDRLAAVDFNTVAARTERQGFQPSFAGYQDLGSQLSSDKRTPITPKLVVKLGSDFLPYSVLVPSYRASSPTPDVYPILNADFFQGNAQPLPLAWLMTNDSSAVGSSVGQYNYVRAITPWDWCRLRVKQSDSSSSDDASKLTPGMWCGPTDCSSATTVDKFADSLTAARGTITAHGFGLMVLGDAGDWQDPDDDDSPTWHTRWCTAYFGELWFWAKLVSKVADGHWTVQIVNDADLSDSYLGIVDAYCAVAGGDDYPLDGTTYCRIFENRRMGRWEIDDITECPT